MPRKIRQLKAELQRAGFRWRPGKGDHTVWSHPAVPALRVTLDGKDGDDVEPYQERQTRAALRAIEQAEAERARGGTE